MKRHKLLNNRNERLFNRLLENQGLEHKGSIKEEEVTEGEMCPKCGKSPCVCEDKKEPEIDPMTKASDEEEVNEGIMAMHCPQCGTLNSKANNHCTNCGAKLKGEEDVKEAAKPDFLDLDKDGDKEEPMADAAEDAKDKKEDK